MTTPHAYKPLELSSPIVSSLLKTTILLAICVLASISRQFSVITFETIIHEFDPWFNFRATKILVDEGVFVR